MNAIITKNGNAIIGNDVYIPSEKVEELVEALVKAESALTYANWDGEFDDIHTTQDVINVRDATREVLKKWSNHAA